MWGRDGPDSLSQEAHSGWGITTYSESNVGSVRLQLNVGGLRIISGWVILFANPPPVRMLKSGGGNKSCWVPHWADPERIKERTVKIYHKCMQPEGADCEMQILYEVEQQ
jgi:hypothetical protein